MLLGYLERVDQFLTIRYVALMPGVYWYPVPGPAKGDYVSSQIGLDYFDLDLNVELTTDDWQLVGTEAIALASEGKNLIPSKTRKFSTRDWSLCIRV